MIQRALWLAVLASVFLAPARADFAAGQRAWDAGRMDEALTQWRDAAHAGDGRAMRALGQAHLQGFGVLQDYVEAHKWFNLAASRGDAGAAQERDALAAKMTPAQVATAQERAAAWQPDPTRSEAAATAPATAAVPAEQTPTQPETAQAAAPPSPEVAAASTPPQPDSAPGPDVTPGPAPPYAIREAQSLLAKLGYRPGPADGVWGDATRAAFRAFLDAEGLPAAETLTPQALRAVRAAARRGSADAGGSEEVQAEGAEGARTDVSEEAPEEVAAEAAPRPPAPPRVDLHAAVRAGDSGEVTAALSAGADVNGRDDRGRTALMHAVNEGRSPLVELLLASKANPDHRASDGSTALHVAVGLGHAEIVALLREAGADPWIEGPDGRTAAEAARAGGSAAVVAALRLPRKGEVFRDCAECPPMVVVEEGRYMMGSPRDEAGRWDDEGPRHEVRIARPFAVGRFEVTFAQWDACRRAGRCSHAPDDEGWGRGTRPVINVSWNDAQEYAGWLSEKTGETYRLPSEAEWEYAARAKTNSAYYWGEVVRPRRARCSRCDGGSGGIGTVSVGDFPPNGFGLFDMLGNVWEWVEDCGHRDYTGAPSDGSAWTRPGDCRVRMMRGGSWEDATSRVRSAMRDWKFTDTRQDVIGFRVARTLR